MLAILEDFFFLSNGDNSIKTRNHSNFFYFGRKLILDYQFCGVIEF